MVAAYQESIDSESSADEAHYHVTEDIDEDEEDYEVVAAPPPPPPPPAPVEAIEKRKDEVAESPVSDEDEEEVGDGNPMVMGYADDVSDDDVISREQPPLDDYDDDGVTDGNDDDELDSKMNPAEDAGCLTLKYGKLCARRFDYCINFNDNRAHSSFLNS